MSDGTGNCGFCECGKPLVPSRYWIHDDDVLAATAGMCNCCGEEAAADTECCEDGEVVPARDVDGAP